MNKNDFYIPPVLLDMYEKTEDAKIVAQYMGQEVGYFGCNFITGVLLRPHADTILEEAKRREAERLKKGE